MGGSAFAQSYPHRNDGGHNTQLNHNRPGNDHRGPPARATRGYDDHHHADRGRGAGPQHNFYRGGRIPREYRNRQYVIDNWRAHRLHAPNRGYQWVQVGADYVLVAIATGVITQIVINGR